MPNDPKDLVLHHWQHANARSWSAFASLLAADLVYEVPQTRERIVGAAGYLDFFQTWPGPWRADVVSTIAEGAHVVTVINFVTDAEQMTGITFFELEAGQIVRITDYWPSPYEPPRRASQHVQRY
jgi:ketosteroid isomerase-like protein